MDSFSPLVLVSVVLSVEAKRFELLLCRFPLLSPSCATPGSGERRRPGGRLIIATCERPKGSCVVRNGAHPRKLNASSAARGPVLWLCRGPVLGPAFTERGWAWVLPVAHQTTRLAPPRGVAVLPLPSGRTRARPQRAGHRGHRPGSPGRIRAGHQRPWGTTNSTPPVVLF